MMGLSRFLFHLLVLAGSLSVTVQAHSGCRGISDHDNGDNYDPYSFHTADASHRHLQEAYEGPRICGVVDATDDELLEAYRIDIQFRLWRLFSRPDSSDDIFMPENDRIGETYTGQGYGGGEKDGFEAAETPSARTDDKKEECNSLCRIFEFLSNFGLSPGGGVQPSLPDTTSQPTGAPTSAASSSKIPSVAPTETKSSAPSGSPSVAASTFPSGLPSVEPSVTSSNAPSESSSMAPSHSVSSTPTPPTPINEVQNGGGDSSSDSPSVSGYTSPSDASSKQPSSAPSPATSEQPSISSSSAPSKSSSVQPSESPSTAPSVAFSDAPSSRPSATPTITSSSAPSSDPSGTPSMSPSSDPSIAPSRAPSGSPIVAISFAPSMAPTKSRVTSVSEKKVVPTVYHVVEKTSAGPNHVTDQGVMDSNDVLNDAFAEWGFEFKVEGITRNVNDAWWSARSGTAAEHDMKNSLHVGIAETLNVYLTGGGGLLGWATLPRSFAGRPYYDGVVCAETTVPGGASSRYGEGDTLVHEVGHWLGLYHTFQGGCSSYGDGIEDTPSQSKPNFGCPNPFPNSCPDKPGIDPLNNFMDYVDDDCMFQFTEGQGDRMLSQWCAYRGLCSL